MTDVPLDVVTGLLFGATTATAIVAALGIRREGANSRNALADAATERAQNAEARRCEFQAAIVLGISKAFETYIHQPGAAEHQANIRSGLAALPVDELQVLRVMVGVQPSADAERRWRDMSANGTRNEAIRNEITELLQRLTGASLHGPDWSPALTASEQVVAMLNAAKEADPTVD